jgi:hypothetical protein
MPATGVCRIKDGWGNQDSVIVRYDDGKQFELPRSQYEAQGYQPPFAQLPACSPGQRATPQVSEDVLRKAQELCVADGFVWDADDLKAQAVGAPLQPRRAGGLASPGMKERYIKDAMLRLVAERTGGKPA